MVDELAAENWRHLSNQGTKNQKAGAHMQQFF
jgi:hypothetical protein